MDKNKIQKVLYKAKQDPVFFAENFLTNQQMQKYKLEDQQKLFLRDQSPYKILFCSRRSGKTLTMIIDMLHKAFFRPNQQIALIAPTLDQSKTFANVFNDMILRTPMLQSSFITSNKLDKQLSNGSRIAFKTAGAASGKKEDSNLVGSGLNTLYLDEAQSVDADAMATIMPVVTGQIGQAEIVMAGTPRARTGFFFDNIQNAKCISECYINNGKPSLEFLDSISMPFYSDLIALAFTARPPSTFSSLQPACAGIDFGKKRNISSLTIATQTPQMTWEAKYYKRWQLGTKYTEILHFVNNIVPKSFPNLKVLAIDQTGVGNVLTEGVNHNSFYDVLDIVFSQPSKVSMVEGLVSSMENQFLTFMPDRLLEKEMAEYSRETTENDRVIYTKGESDDCLDSAMLCNVAINHYIQNGQHRTKPFKSFSLGQNVIGNKSYQQKRRRDRYTKKRK